MIKTYVIIVLREGRILAAHRKLEDFELKMAKDIIAETDDQLLAFVPSDLAIAVATTLTRKVAEAPSMG